MRESPKKNPGTHHLGPALAKFGKGKGPKPSTQRTPSKWKGPKRVKPSKVGKGKTTINLEITDTQKETIDQSTENMV